MEIVFLDAARPWSGDVFAAGAHGVNHESRKPRKRQA